MELPKPRECGVYKWYLTLTTDGKEKVFTPYEIQKEIDEWNIVEILPHFPYKGMKIKV